MSFHVFYAFVLHLGIKQHASSRARYMSCSVDMNSRPSVIPITDINSVLYVITLSIHLVNL